MKSHAPVSTPPSAPPINAPCRHGAFTGVVRRRALCDEALCGKVRERQQRQRDPRDARAFSRPVVDGWVAAAIRATLALTVRSLQQGAAASAASP